MKHSYDPSGQRTHFGGSLARTAFPTNSAGAVDQANRL